VADNHIVITPIEGVALIERPVFSDDRGFFHEIERRADLESAFDRTIRHAQWNHSRSHKSVLRGIHVAQWNKCVYVVRGNAQVVICDVRKHSKTFGQHVSFVIGERRRAAVFVPAGCGNSFLALDRLVDYMYSVDAAWYPDGEFGIAWNDPDLAIDWQVKQPLVSARDRHNPLLRERFPERFEAAPMKGRRGVPGLTRNEYPARLPARRELLVGSGPR
jgi:dTDP-4-dehydrorhamnose 3,5-epimerase